MIVRKVLRVFSLGNLLLIVTGVLILYMGSTFVQQASAHKQRQAELDQLEEGLEAARQEEALLEEQLQYIQSPEAAEAWARENGWAKTDEIAVVVVAPQAEASQQEEQHAEESDSPASRRASWWDLFFGER